MPVVHGIAGLRQGAKQVAGNEQNAKQQHALVGPAGHSAPETRGGHESSARRINFSRYLLPQCQATSPAAECFDQRRAGWRPFLAPAWRWPVWSVPRRAFVLELVCLWRPHRAVCLRHQLTIFSFLRSVKPGRPASWHFFRQASFFLNLQNLAWPGRAGLS